LLDLLAKVRCGQLGPAATDDAHRLAFARYKPAQRRQYLAVRQVA
jgi:hypothetical protein